MNKIKLNSISLNGNSLNGNSLNGIGDVASSEKLQENEILAIYDVVSTSEPTLLLGLGNLLNIERMSIDGVDITKTGGYIFLKLGLHRVKIKVADKLSTLENFFNGATQLIFADLSKLNTSNLKSTRRAFRSCTNLKNLKLQIASTVFWDGFGTFALCRNLKQVVLNWDVPNLTNMDYAFTQARIESVVLDFKQTAFFTSFNGVFEYSDVVNIDLSSIDLRDVILDNWINLAENYRLTNMRAFFNWRANTISIIDSPLLSPESIHSILERAMDGADGAVARNLSLHATAKANWMASGYYYTDVLMANEKLITIA